MKNSISKFLLLVQEDCTKHGVEIVFHPKEEIKLSKTVSVSGYWSDDDRQLNVAIYCDEWLTVLAHEYGHFCQWKENKFTGEETSNAYLIFDEWLEGKKEISKKRIDKICQLIQECELDCEKRALTFIKKFKLYKNEKLYIQKANSYVLGYAAAKINRKWFKKPPSRLNAVYSSMSKSFTKSLTPNKKQLQLLLEHCF
jgi:hypothetical protein